MADGSTSHAGSGDPTVASEYTVKAGESHGAFNATVTVIEEFNAEIDEELKDAIHSGGRVTRSHLLANSPRSKGEGGGEYARDWSCDYEDREGHHEAVVHNRKHYQLTHLLVDGHDAYNQYGGSYGRVDPAEPRGFMDDALERGQKAIEDKLGVG